MLFIITFFFIFGWKITPYMDISAIIACILTIQYFYLHKEWKQTYKNPTIISLLLLTIYTLLLALSTGITDLFPIFRSARALIILTASFSLFNMYKGLYKKPTQKISYHIYLSIFVHSIIAILMYTNTPFRNLVYSITSSSEYVNLNSPYLTGTRTCGLTYGFSQTSVLHLLGFLILPILFDKSNKYCSKIFLLLSFPIILTSSLLIGRSGIFLGIVLIPIYLILKIKLSEFNIKKVAHSLKFIILGIISLGILFGTAYWFLPTKFKRVTVNNSMEIFEAFKLKGSTIEELTTMFFLPKTVPETIFGVGNYGRTDSFQLDTTNNYQLDSDVGWVRSIFAIGLIGVFFMIYPFIWGIYISLNLDYNSRKIAISAILIFLASLLLNFKELSLLTRNQWTIQAILLVILANCDKKGIKKQ